MRVSVIIPAYNRSSQLQEAMASVLAQDFQDFELIIVDDGSTDDTRQKVAACPDSRIRYHYRPNGGVAKARNLGLSLARGTYIAWLDSDDLWPPDYLSTMISRLEENPDCGVAYGRLTNVYPDGRRRTPSRGRRCASGRITRDLFHSCFVYIIATVMRREAVEGLFFDESLRTIEDTDLMLRLSRQTRFLFVPEVHVTRRMSPDSLSLRSSCRQLEINKIRVLERFYCRLGGNEHLPRRQAMRRLSKSYREAACRFYNFGAWAAAARLFRRAAAHNPCSLKAYLGWARALLKPRRSDAMPGWQEPPPLSDEIQRSAPPAPGRTSNEPLAPPPGIPPMNDTQAPPQGYEDYYLRLNPPSPENYKRKARGYARQFARLLDPAGISSCLDLGCGIGLFAFYLRSRGHDVVGVDLNETLAAHARANVDAQFVVDDAARYLASAGRKFDMISMLDVIEHIPHEGVIPLLAAIRGALTEKGFALIRTPNMNAPAALGMFYSDWTHCTPFTEATLLHVGLTAGFSRVEFVDQYASMRWWARMRAHTTAMLGRRLATMRGGHVPKVYHRHLIAQLLP